MKRSEMVTHVIKTLYPNDIEISLYEQNRISKILKIIEDAGMLPPKYTKFLDDSGVKKPSEVRHSECPVVGKYSVRYTMPNYVDVNEWEEE